MLEVGGGRVFPLHSADDEWKVERLIDFVY
jgi:hypothetical protein